MHSQFYIDGVGIVYFGWAAMAFTFGGQWPSEGYKAPKDQDEKDSVNPVTHESYTPPLL